MASNLRRTENLRILKTNELIVTGSATLSDTTVGGDLVVSNDVNVGSVLILNGGTAAPPPDGLTYNIDPSNLTNTYIAFRPNGADSDFAFLRQLGASDAYMMSLDFHDNGDDAGFQIRDIQSVGATADTIITRFKLERGTGYVSIGTDAPQNRLTVVGNANIMGNVGIGITVPSRALDVAGDANISGSLFASGVTIANAGVKTFRIPHPVLPDTELIHSCIEGPRADLIYRGRKRLAGGVATVDLNRESTGNGATMVAGTFEALCAHPQVFVTNNETWDRVRGSVDGATLTVTAESPTADCWIDWMVVAERKDATIKTSPLTDADGFLILEHPLRH